MDLRPFLRNINLLNCILIAACLIFTADFLFPQRDSNVSFVLPPLKKVPMQKTQNELPKAQIPSPMDYVIIADENLFHPERKIPIEKKEEAAIPKPEFILYGTLITPDLKIAYLEDKKSPVSTPGRGKRQSALKKGETLSGYTVKEILANKVVMTRGEETITVLLDDPKAPKTREAALTTGPQPHIPGIPGTMPQAPAGGQLPRQPTPPRPAAFPSGGMPIAPTPQPSSSQGIASPMPVSPVFPSRRPRTIQPTAP